MGYENPVKFRLWVGPIFQPASDATAYNWSTDLAEQEEGHGFAAAATTLQTSMTSGSTSVTMATTPASFPPKGGAFVGGNGAGQGWEYIRYASISANTLNGIVREPSTDRDHNGAHTAGAVVTPWLLISGDNGSLRMVMESDENLACADWYIEVSGVNAPRHLLKSKHICVVELLDVDEFSPNWYIFAVGWIESPKMNDDHRRRGDWTLRIRSLGWILDKIPSRGLRIGDLDLAKYATSTSSSSQLYDYYTERASGDFVAAEPDVSAASVADRDDGTLWIAERFHGVAVVPDANSDPTYGMSFKLKFTHIYINPPPGSRPGRRFIEFTVTAAGSFSGLDLFSASGGGSMVQWAFGGPGSLGAYEKFVLCEDEAVYLEEHPLSEHKWIKADAGFWPHLSAAGGTFGLRLGALDQWWTIVKWGTGGGGLSVADVNSPPTWSGTAVAAPAYGQTMRYLHEPAGTPTQSAHYWWTGMVQHAGYDIADSPASWLRVDLPPMGLRIRDDFNSSFTGDIFITDGATPSTAGLPSSGTLQVGDEQMTISARYADRITISARGQGGTTAAAHKADDPVYIVDGGVKTDAHLIKSVGWKRAGGTNYPKDYRIKVSKLPDARDADESGYNADWSEIYNTSSGAVSSYTVNLSPSQRVRSILIQIEEMTTDVSRPRINEVIAQADPATFDSSLYMNGPQYANQIIRQLALNAGLPAGAVAAPVNLGEQITGITTADSNSTWEVIKDFADFANMFAYAAPIGWIGANVNSLWKGTISPGVTLTRAEVFSVEEVKGSNEAVSQVELHWRTGDGTGGGVVRYPSVAWGDGAVWVIPDAVFANSTEATTYATRRFFCKRYPYVVLAEHDAAPMWQTVYPSQVYGLVWAFDPAQPAATHTFVVTDVEATLERQKQSVVFHMLAIQRTSDA